jgi:hypothetical protein
MAETLLMVPLDELKAQEERAKKKEQQKPKGAEFIKKQANIK